MSLFVRSKRLMLGWVAGGHCWCLLVCLVDDAALLASGCGGCLAAWKGMCEICCRGLCCVRLRCYVRVCARARARVC